MSIKKNQIDEKDLARHMGDQACRAESNSLAQKKYSHLQRLMSKISALSDKEFDIAFSTLESMLENFNTKKTKKEDDKISNKNKENAINIITNKQ
ncbi:hypothetical protein [Fluviispira multicolorata]|uniref:Uncharacterized protein n=1 Tax=Fluviispira multicolorata TaxID=2654512 RepID=A0A833JD73_9BACT|nr:hypothetical protein [Fluviispira multicolorata]KAB8028138.1 hypothetical protein GCL57_13905 [Fluviispira multicolorata]